MEYENFFDGVFASLEAQRAFACGFGFFAAFTEFLLALILLIMFFVFLCGYMRAINREKRKLPPKAE